MVNRFVLFSFVFIGAWFSSINAMKRKLEDHQKSEVTKKLCVDYLSINTQEFDVLYSTNYLPISAEQTICLKIAEVTYMYHLNQNWDKETIYGFFDVGWNFLISTHAMKITGANLLSAMALVFNGIDDDLWDKPQDDQILYRTAIAKALRDPLISLSMGSLAQFFKIFIYNLHHGANAKKLFEVFSPLGKAHELDTMLFACNKTLALTRRGILRNLEKNDFKAIEEIPEKIRFHPTMITNQGQSILAWLIQNRDQLDLDLVKLFIGHFTWDKEAVCQAAQTKQRYDIINELHNFQNNCNDMID